MPPYRPYSEVIPLKNYFSISKSPPDMATCVKRIISRKKSLKPLGLSTWAKLVTHDWLFLDFPVICEADSDLQRTLEGQPKEWDLLARRVNSVTLYLYLASLFGNFNRLDFKYLFDIFTTAHNDFTRLTTHLSVYFTSTWDYKGHWYAQFRTIKEKSSYEGLAFWSCNDSTPLLILLAQNYTCVELRGLPLKLFFF